MRVLRSLCAGLVTVDGESGIIRLVHHTTQEYFERTRKQWFPNAQSEITTICVRYLSFSTFENGFCKTDDEFEERLGSYPLYEYAANNWGHHARKALTPCDGVIEFLEDAPKVEASAQAVMDINTSWTSPQRSQCAPKQMTGLHLAAYFGVQEAVKSLLVRLENPDSNNSHERTLLSYASEKGHEATVQLLLEEKVDIGSKDIYGLTPLSWAAGTGQEAIVQLLLAAKADVNSKDNCYHRTPLLWTAERGHEAVIRLLLAETVDIDSKDKSGRTPL